MITCLSEWVEELKRLHPDISWIEDLGRLALEEGEYCIVGGAVELMGIRRSGDVDLLVTPKAFERIAEEFNLKVSTSFLGSSTCSYKEIEVFMDDGFGKSSEEWISRAVKVKGLMAGCPEDLLEWKKKLTAKPGRNPEKLRNDQVDIEALEKLVGAK